MPGEGGSPGFGPHQKLDLGGGVSLLFRAAFVRKERKISRWDMTSVNSSSRAF